MLQGCATRPINEPIAHVEPESGYRVVSHVMRRPGHDPSTLLILAFSGGCDQAGITPLVPKPLTSNSKADGRFDKRDFVYIAADDEYRCPAGQRAIKRFTTIENGMTLHKYWSSACPRCPLKAQCTTGDYRRIARWEHEAVLEAMQERLDRQPDAMKLRRQTVEHPFGTLKAWMGATHFLTKRLPRVSTEMSLHVLAYNLKRVMQILGIVPLMQAMRT